MLCAQVTNLVSNDVRRFDDGMPFWCFLWGAPLELACVLILLSVELGAPSAFAGVATMLLVIPLQACSCFGGIVVTTLGNPPSTLWQCPRYSTSVLSTLSACC